MKRTLRSIALSVLSIACFQTAFAQPSNDNCSNSRVLVVTPVYTSTAANADGATQSLPPIECNNFTADTSRDVWFSFVATSANLKVKIVCDANYDAVVALYSSCSGSATACADMTVNGGEENMTANGLTIGLTYYIRVYHFQFGTPYPGEARFDIGVYNAPAAPSNDNCAEATQLVCGTSCNNTVVDAAEATETLPSSTCAGFQSLEARDVWFRFTATTPNALIKVDPMEEYDAVIVLYNACNGSEIDCADRGVNGEMENINTSSLTVGNQYIIRVYHYTEGGYPENAGFDICVYTPPPAPANDNCSGAILVTTYNGNSCAPTAANTENATQSTDTINCSNTSFDDDLWYKFVATTNAVVVKVSNITGFTDGIGMTLYESCGGDQRPECEFSCPGDSLTFNDLTIGQTYYLRMFSSLAVDRGTFEFCVLNRQTPDRPTNDECSGAVSLNVGVNANCNSIPGTAFYASESYTPINCGNGAAPQAADVWYSFVAKAPEVTVEVTGDLDFDAVIEAFSDCSGTSVGCVDAEVVGGVTETLALTGLTVNQAYYVRVYQYDPSSTTPGFSICAYINGTGITNNSAKLVELKMYPNPAKDKVTIDNTRADEIRVMDNVGRVVMQLKNISSTEGLDFNLGSLEPGLYFVEGMKNGRLVAASKLQKL